MKQTLADKLLEEVLNQHFPLFNMLDTKNQAIVRDGYREWINEKLMPIIEESEQNRYREGLADANFSSVGDSLF